MGKPRDKALRNTGLAVLCQQIKSLRATLGGAIITLGESIANDLDSKADLSTLTNHTSNTNNPHVVTAKQVHALPESGGTLTGNLTGKYITGTWLQTTSNSNLGRAADKVAVQDASGWLYYRTAAQLLGDIGAAKKPLSGSVTIPTTGWSSDSTATYPKYYDIAVTGVETSDRANIDIAAASLSAAVTCGLCPVTETLAGKIRIRAASVPTAALTANYFVEKGA